MSDREFTKAEIAEAESIKISKELLAGRPVVKGYTIDGTNSRDLDDGIYLSRKNDNYLLEVSISDVGSVITPGTKLFKAAFQKAETVYYRYINKPMLPRVLSENRLSLLPGSLKPAITFDIEIRPDGEVENFGIRETAFKNMRKLSYGEFDQIAFKNPDDPEHALFSEMAKLAAFLLERRRQKGALAIYDIMKGIFTNEEGRILPLSKEMSHISNIVIQEFMIMTNKALAVFFAEKDVPFLYRNHTARQSAPDRKQILEQIALAVENPQFILPLHKRGSLWFNRAYYGPTTEGHFGLNEPLYTHITSPIRRVADLINHLIIKAYLRDKGSPFSFKGLKGMSNKVNEIISLHKDEKTQIQKEKEEYNALLKLNYSTKNELAYMPSDSFAPVLKTAARNDYLFSNLEAALEKRFELKKVDPKMLFRILFETPENSSDWLKLKLLAFDYIKKKKGLPALMLNTLEQKGMIEELNHEITESGEFFISKTSANINGRLITAESDPEAKRKKIAMHESACNFIRLMLDLPASDDIVSIQEKNDGQALSTSAPKEYEAEATDENVPENNESYKDMLKQFAKKMDANGKSKSNSPGLVSVPEDDNYVGQLFEICSKNEDLKAPVFSFSSRGPHHEPEIICVCAMKSKDLDLEAEAVAGSKKSAKKIAAKKMIDRLNEKGFSISSALQPVKIFDDDNYIGILQEICAKSLVKPPEYKFVQVGTLSTPKFQCTVFIEYKGKKHKYTGFGKTKKSAKKIAAKNCLTLFD